LNLRITKLRNEQEENQRERRERNERENELYLKLKEVEE
jgi:hypothetical protein